MRALTLFVLLIVVIILICYFTRRDPERKLDKSNGTFDEPAQEALKDIDEKKEKTAQDYIDRADITLHNVLEDDLHTDGIDKAGTAHNIANDYATGLDLLPADDPRVGVVAERMRAMGANNAAVPMDAEEAELQDVLIRTYQVANASENKKADQRIAAVRRRTAGRAGAANTYLKESVHYDNDRQNVHDSQVNIDLRATLGMIMQPHIKTSDEIDEIRKYVREKQADGEITGDTAIRASTTISKMEEGNKVSALNSNENFILATVWARSKHPENADNSDNIKNSIVKSLADSYEGTGLVCANGRCGRVIGSLAQTDFNEAVGNVGSFQMFKNEIIKESNNAMTREMASIEKDDPAAIKAWNDGQDRPDVSERLAAKINSVVDEYSDRLPEQSLKVIRDVCIRAIE